MQKKSWQVTDNVHGTIYISSLEHQMMSTPFFYRLHDVYQSSTVYMTYPSNRTKRYEHSLGTMHLAGQMFFSLVSNAEKDVRESLFKALEKPFKDILDVLSESGKAKKIFLYQIASNKLSKLVMDEKTENYYNFLANTMADSPIADSVLQQQAVCFSGLISQNDSEAHKKTALYSFLYQCTLEAIRIAALFHDIGHPPFSHIIEFTMRRLYNRRVTEQEKVGMQLSEKVMRFKECLSAFEQCKPCEDLILDQVNHDEHAKDPALHEQIGLRMLHNAFKNVMDQYEKEEYTENDSERVRALYLITVMEFTMGILLEKLPVLGALHRIIDGSVDVDRLDYVVRDAFNAGVNWGRASYSRIITAAKLFYYDSQFVIAFPEKVCDDIDDLLVNRYKIFQRINYHHKSVKTSELMQRVVELLAEDFLIVEPGKEIMPDIEQLWLPLRDVFGLGKAENQISHWTDAWLVSVLGKTFDTLNNSEARRRLLEGNTHSEKELERIKNIIEELQLNRKHYFPLLKRQRDALQLTEQIIKKASLDNLAELSAYEHAKLNQNSPARNLSENLKSVLESLYRISILDREILEVADFSLMKVFFPTDKSIEQQITEMLKSEKEKGTIEDYFLWNNRGFFSWGISGQGKKIYLYREKKCPYVYDVSTTLTRRLRAQQAGCLWLFVYVCISEENIQKNCTDKILRNLFDQIADQIALSIRDTIRGLFEYDIEGKRSLASAATSQKMMKISGSRKSSNSGGKHA